jgi:peptide deformylase
MALLDIIKYPDPLLKEQSIKVESFDVKLGNLLDSMAETMYSANGIGLAAPQVAELLQVAVIDVSKEGNQLQEFINPVIISQQGKTKSEEGCLSIPEYRDTIQRSVAIVVRAQDRNGKEFELEAEGLLAICLQHEIDHLNGVLFIDRLSRLKRELFKRWFLKQQRELA